MSWTETVLKKSCLSLCPESFIYGGRSWKISMNNKADSATFSQQWILSQPLLLLTLVEFDYSVPPSSCLRLKLKKVKKIIRLCSVPNNFYIFWNILFLDWSKTPNFPLWNHRETIDSSCCHNILKSSQGSLTPPATANTLKHSISINFPSLYLNMLLLFLWQYILMLYSSLLLQVKFTRISGS